MLWFEITLLFLGTNSKAQHRRVFWDYPPQHSPRKTRPFLQSHMGETETLRFLPKPNGLGVCFSGAKKPLGYESKLTPKWGRRILIAKSLYQKC